MVKTIVFVETKKGVDALFDSIKVEHWRSEVKAIHGDKSQLQRDSILNAFREDKCRVLIATDVASRGLDITDVSLVINYDMPFQIEDYVHRIGRTGRAGKLGESITLFSKKNFMIAPQLIEILGQSEEVPPALITLAEFASKASGDIKRRWRPVTTIIKNVVNVGDLIKKRDQKAEEKRL